MSVEQIIINFSYVAIFLLLIVNGVISFPSSQIVYIVAGYFASLGSFNFFLVVIIGAIGNVIGNVILYEIARRKGLDYTLKLFKYLEVTKIDIKREIRKIEVVFRKKGVWFLFFGKLVNPVKTLIPIPAGMSKMNRFVFTSIVTVTSFIWAFGFTFFGYFFGKSFENYGIYGGIMFVLFSVFLVVLYKYMNSEAILKEIE